ncbi:hypothetical protein [Streptomyces sp. TRM75563]|uniref:hypothetical protein n=1 Tax=Streptomyces sp. TRM75563 TaxID=2817418 RepID=UPI001F608B8B|nr:hypothetical protein [Streptomyces sp. TRM75563]MCI4045371.1 hypothetical protein [Streptomyces sp. TRM75563]
MTSDFSPDTVKHLEFIQAVIARLSNASFLIKGWSMTLTAAIIGLAASQNDLRICAAAIIPVAGFWVLDSYFLKQERQYRNLYDGVRTGLNNIEKFAMNPSSSATQVRHINAFSSKLMVFFYGTPIAALATLAIAALAIRK